MNIKLRIVSFTDMNGSNDAVGILALEFSKCVFASIDYKCAEPKPIQVGGDPYYF